MKVEIGNLENPASRKDYFRPWAPGKILNGAGVERKGNAMRKNIDWLRVIAEQAPDKIVLGAKGARSIDDLVQGRYTRDRASVTSQIEDSKNDEIIVLPACYRLGGWDAQKAIAFDHGTLVRLDSVHAKRQLPEFDETWRDEFDFTTGFNYQEMQTWNMTPERMLHAAVDAIRDQNPEKTRVGYAWRSPSNPGLHVVSLLHCIEGLELRLMQDYAAWKVLPELLEGKRGRKVEQKLRNIEKYTRFFDAKDLLPRLDLSAADMIERQCRPNSRRRGWHMRVPSRSHPGKYHSIIINNMPIKQFHDSDLYALKHTWSVSAQDKGESEQEYREGRRHSPGRDTPSKQDVYFTANSIAALHSIRKIHRYKPAGWACADLPIAIAREELQNHADALRYRTVILDTNSKREPIVRTLGKTEIEDWLWARVQLSGFRSCLTTRPQNLYSADVKNMMQFYEEGERYVA
ncbi:hypothetical protein CL619_03960 [archaeon]|nr:hypothetical protein [archaeon]|tara:strand:- start:1621 stop:3000 length:1380 start_codon:yes stop_codon:yes gene_type:complete